ncbi:Sugar phosphate permease [Bradyrhizobium lablabi]|uniref:Sugar phosphate permease n=1 Tax=Bradyrhizobium lablabi TaxID=722472 RepID=A0A1M6QR03_9BRAD|nr:MFS transporter [Bradyrhizobium lablabi]SHK22457.1 Sugar phosphate permease [Bradyrhizobium lablabi]
MNHLGYRWVIVAAGALMTCVGIGAMFSLAVYLAPMSVETGWSRAGISSAMTLDFLTMGVAGFGWGALSDRIGTRIVVLIGAVLLGAGLVLASRATSLIEFQLVYGILVGLAAGAFFAPMIAAATQWFENNRSLAVSLVSAGMGVAPMTISPFARWLISTYDWRVAMMTIGIGAWILLIPAALLVRKPPAASTTGAASPLAIEAGGAGMSATQALRSPQFMVLALTFFGCCAAHSGPIFHMVSYAISCGVPAMAAVSIYSLEGLSGLGGRLLLGVLADRLGAKPVLIAGLLVQALAIATYLFVNRLGEFYALSVIFGTAYGGVMPLYAVLAREYFGQRIMGTIFGAATMVSSLGMAIGPLAGGFVFDTFNAYSWLYIGSFSLGLGAMAVAFAFPPLPRSRDQLQVA